MVTRDEVRRWSETRRHWLLEALAREELDDEHISGAINITLRNVRTKAETEAEVALQPKGGDTSERC